MVICTVLCISAKQKTKASKEDTSRRYTIFLFQSCMKSLSLSLCILTVGFYLFQSVVLVSRLPFIALFNQLVSIIAPEYFDNGEPSLEAGNGRFKPYH